MKYTTKLKIAVTKLSKKIDITKKKYRSAKGLKKESLWAELCLLKSSLQEKREELRGAMRIYDHLLGIK